IKGKVKALALGGVAPTQENVGKGTYPLIRRFFIVTKGNPSPTLARFLEFVRSADGAKVVTELNAVPVK
ncbi:MAG: substrate-binding domain-containing protein, partial [candidate division NC10 bacterium]